MKKLLYQLQHTIRQPMFFILNGNRQRSPDLGKN